MAGMKFPKGPWRGGGVNLTSCITDDDYRPVSVSTRGLPKIVVPLSFREFALATDEASEAMTRLGKALAESIDDDIYSFKDELHEENWRNARDQLALPESDVEDW